MTSQFSQGNVFPVPNDKMFSPEIQKAGDRLVIVDFTASWCGPCRRIAPVFAELSIQYPAAVFLKVDVDQCQMTAAMYDVRAMPTFMFFKNGNKVDEMKGADPTVLESKIKQWIATVNVIVADPKRVAVGQSYDCFQQLMNNPHDVFMDVSELLIKFATNIINNPGNPKYKSIRVGNKIFQSRLLPVSGGVECLFVMGFEENEEYLVFPTNGSMENMKNLRDALHQGRSKSPTSLPHQPPAPMQQQASTAASQADELEVFYNKLQSMAAHVSRYEEPELQAKIQSIMPVEEFKKKAQEASRRSKEGGEEGVNEEDCVLLELTSWFKGGFFKWVDQPACPSCNVPSERQGYATPTPEEAKWGVGNVESYRCPKCLQQIRFPRYNHPAKLLETRTGRCGEWANCFTLCCRALGFETRYVVDWTDHVWTEVYSEGQHRWIHFDSCEGICDKPLIYENGWGKNLTYIVAFSVEEIVDVTWRYSCKHKEVLKNRTSVSENWLVDTLKGMTKERQRNLSPERKALLEKRAMEEMIEFLSIKSATDGEDQGRISGSLAWRQMRGEAGKGVPPKKHKSFIFKPTKGEIEARRFRLRYCPASDKYYRVRDHITKDTVHAIEGWESGVAVMETVFRKVELDWQMVYLARTEGSPTGSVVWQVDFSDSGLVVDCVTIVTRSTTFENGQVIWKLVGEEENQALELATGDEPLNSKILHGSKTLKLSATLSGGSGNNAWQHAQLFRQKTSSIDEFPLDISVTLCDP